MRCIKKQLQVTIQPQPPSGTGNGAAAAVTGFATAFESEAEPQLAAEIFESGGEIGSLARASRSGTGGIAVSSIDLPW
jgi:hypothetical protein